MTLLNLERQESGFVAYWWRICGAGGPGTFDRCLRIFSAEAAPCRDRALALMVQGGYLSGLAALPVSFAGNIVKSYEDSAGTTIMPLKLTGRAARPPYRPTL